MVNIEDVCEQTGFGLLNKITEPKIVFERCVDDVNNKYPDPSEYIAIVGSIGVTQGTYGIKEPTSPQEVGAGDSVLNVNEDYNVSWAILEFNPCAGQISLRTEHGEDVLVRGGNCNCYSDDVDETVLGSSHNNYVFKIGVNDPKDPEKTCEVTFLNVSNDAKFHELALDYSADK